MIHEEIANECTRLAEECERLARRAEGVSFPIGQAVYNAGANLHDAAQMARHATRGGKR